MKSIFSKKSHPPSAKDLKEALGDTLVLWQSVANFTRVSFPLVKEEWNFPGEKYGWSFRMSDKKRVIVYLLPRDKFFKVAFVFGQKAVDKILQSSISQSIKEELLATRIYAEGRGIRIDVKDESLLQDIKELIKIKIAN
jgi:hypothetical protein